MALLDEHFASKAFLSISKHGWASLFSGVPVRFRPRAAGFSH
jgi:hypothetical protein